MEAGDAPQRVARPVTTARPADGSARAPIEARLAAAGLPPLPRLAWLEVDLGILAANAATIRGMLPAGTALGIVVKADGYGHGLEAAACAAIRGGADMLIVATLDEALVLRGAGLEGRILVLYPVPPAMLAAALDANLDLVAADDASVVALAGALGPRGGRAAPPGLSAARIHLGIDTGMTRGGIAPERAAGAARQLLDAGLERLAGTWSHLAAPEDPESVAAQVARFETALDALAVSGIDPGLRHLDASGGLLGGTGRTYDLVRIGLAFYGVRPEGLAVSERLATAAASLQPAMSLHARATTLATVPAGTRVGYAGTWTAPRRSVIATVAVGYADGWVRSYAGGSWGAVRGVRAPVVGRVSSDAIALDVTGVPGFGMDDEIVLIGHDGAAMSVHDLATLRDSISWEVMDGFTPRLSRVYAEGARPVGVRYVDGRTQFVGAR